jgi:hypothetical protein
LRLERNGAVKSTDNCRRLKDAVTSAMEAAYENKKEGSPIRGYNFTNTSFNPIYRDCECMRSIRKRLNNGNWHVDDMPPIVNSLTLDQAGIAKFSFRKTEYPESPKVMIACESQ